MPREKPPELTLPPPVSEPRSPSSEIPGVSPSAGESIIESDNSVSQHPQGAINNGDGAAAERVGRGTRQGNGAGNSARPDYQVNPKPLYPLIARRLGAQGEVLLRVRVREDGSVAEVELARSSGFALLDESATRTVRENWRFIPARLDGEPVESWVEVPIKFVLAGS
ncbi:MAG: energy transducer TonB [Candidatus Binatia bacterium]